MRSFQRSEILDPVPGRVVALLRRIDLGAGAESRFADQVPQLLEALRQRARVESITASNEIEGVVVSRGRVASLLSGDRPIRDRNEAEFAGYRRALDYLHQEDAGELSVGLILHLHRLLLASTDSGGGALKSGDNLVIDRAGDGQRVIRFRPVSAGETPFFLDELVARTRSELRASLHHPLLVIAAFVLDFLCIHPFDDGNGRVARLLTDHLLALSGYGVGRYVSLEQLILETKDGYYDALQASTDGWFDDGAHRLWPWATYFLGCVDTAYDRFASRVAAGRSGGSKQERVRDFVLLHAPAEFTIADIRRSLPGISDNTIRLVLAELKSMGQIANDGTGRSARWRRP